MSNTVADIKGKGFVFEQTAEQQFIPSPTGTIAVGIGGANWGPLKTPVYMSAGNQEFRKLFGDPIDAEFSKDSSALMLDYHLKKSSVGWFTRLAGPNATKAALELYKPNESAQIVGSKNVKNSSFVFYDGTDGAAQNNEMRIRTRVDEGDGLYADRDISVVVDASEKAVLKTDDLAGVQNYSKNTTLRVVDGNVSGNEEYFYVVQENDGFNKLKTDVDAGVFANSAVGWIYNAMNLIKNNAAVALKDITGAAGLKARRIFGIDTWAGDVEAFLRLDSAIVNASRFKIKGEVEFVAKDKVEGIDFAVTPAPLFSALSTGVNYIAEGGNLTVTEGLFTTVVNQGEIFTKGAGGSNGAQASLVTLTTGDVYVVESDNAGADDVRKLVKMATGTGLSVIYGNEWNSVLDAASVVATTKKILVNPTAGTFTLYVVNGPADAIVLTATTGSDDGKYVDLHAKQIHTHTNTSVPKWVKNAYTLADGDKFYSDATYYEYDIAPAWITTVAANADKVIDLELNKVFERAAGVFSITDLDPIGVTGDALKVPYHLENNNSYYYRFSTANVAYERYELDSGIYILDPDSTGAVANFTSPADDNKKVTFTESTASFAAGTATVDGETYFAKADGALYYRGAAAFTKRLSNDESGSIPDNTLQFISSDRGSLAFIRVIEAFANIFTIDNSTKAFGVNTTIAEVLDQINAAFEADTVLYGVFTEAPQYAYALISSASRLVLSTYQKSSTARIRIKNDSITALNPYVLLGFVNLDDTDLYPTQPAYFEAIGVDSTLTSSWEAFHTGFDGNTIKIVNSNTVDGPEMKIYFRGTLVSSYINYNYTPTSSNYIVKLVTEDPNVNAIVKIALTEGQTIPYGTFLLSGGNSDALTINDADYANEVVKYRNIDLYDLDMLAVSGISSQTVIEKIKEVAEYRKDFFGIVDPPQLLSVPGVIAWHNGGGDGNDLTTDDSAKLDSEFLATYYPWLALPISRPDKTVFQWHAPSTRVVGAIAQNDAILKHKVGAPAGSIRTLFDSDSINQLETYLEDEDKQRLYADVYNNNINPISYTVADGFFIDGQKTTLKTPNALRRINVMRTGLYLKKRIQNGVKFYFWNPTDPIAWSDFKEFATGIFNYLVNVRAIKDDFIVKCDKTTNGPEITSQNGLVAIGEWTPIKTTERIKFISRIKEEKVNVSLEAL